MRWLFVMLILRAMATSQKSYSPIHTLVTEVWKRSTNVDSDLMNILFEYDVVVVNV